MREGRKVHRLLFRGVGSKGIGCATQNKSARIKVGMCEKGGKHIDYCSGGCEVRCSTE